MAIPGVAVSRDGNRADHNHLPMAWHVERVSPAEVYTFRWGRGAGYFTVHAGDIGASHGNEHLVDTVRGVRDWVTEADVAAHARRWLRAAARPLRP